MKPHSNYFSSFDGPQPQPQPILAGKRILVTGGTGSMGKVLVRRLLSSELGTPENARRELENYLNDQDSPALRLLQAPRPS